MRILVCCPNQKIGELTADETVADIRYAACLIAAFSFKRKTRRPGSARRPYSAEGTRPAILPIHERHKRHKENHVAVWARKFTR